jgi:tetratricopeptide (TPR) repeat protein
VSANPTNSTKKVSLYSGMAEFLGNNKIIVIVSVIVLVLALGGLVAFFTYNESVKGKVVLLSEEIDQAYISWLRADEADKNDKEKEFFALTEQARKKYPNTFSVQRALYSEGLYYLEKKDYAKAAEAYLELAEKYEKSYLAPESFFNASGAFEMAGDTDKAIYCLEKILELYKNDSPVGPEACFNLGRIHDGKGNREKAIEYFELLLTDFPESDWTGVAQTRIIELKIKK